MKKKWNSNKDIFDALSAYVKHSIIDWLESRVRIKLKPELQYFFLQWLEYPRLENSGTRVPLLPMVWPYCPCVGARGIFRFLVRMVVFNFFYLTDFNKFRYFFTFSVCFYKTQYLETVFDITFAYIKNESLIIFFCADLIVLGSGSHRLWLQLSNISWKGHGVNTHCPSL